MIIVWLIIVSFAFPPGFHSSVDGRVLPDSTIPALEVQESLERVFKAIEELFVFYNKQYKNLIVDGVYGLRVLEGKCLMAWSLGN